MFLPVSLFAPAALTGIVGASPMPAPTPLPGDTMKKKEVERLLRAVKRKHTKAEIARHCGVNYRAVTHWYSNQRNPSLPCLKLLAQLAKKRPKTAS